MYQHGLNGLLQALVMIVGQHADHGIRITAAVDPLAMAAAIGESEGGHCLFVQQYITVFGTISREKFLPAMIFIPNIGTKSASTPRLYKVLAA